MAKVAVIGTGIAGNVAAYHLAKEHDITVYEANDYIGGHTHTHEITIGDETHNVDTGFIVFNHKTYPNFLQLLGELGVEYQNSDMSFSVSDDKTGLGGDHGLRDAGRDVVDRFAADGAERAPFRRLFRPSLQTRTGLR